LPEGEESLVSFKILYEKDLSTIQDS
jgi:hypothetical protein